MAEKKAPRAKKEEQPAASEVEAQKAVEEIMAESAKAAGSLLQTEQDLLGTPPETDAAADPGQADFLPGTRRHDPTYLPERIYDETVNRVRRVTLPSDYHYIWVEGSKINGFRTNGYRFCQYDGGGQSGLAYRGFLGTGLFERTLDNHIRNGDTFLMFAPQRLYEQIQQEDRDQVASWNRAAQTDLHNEGYKRGVRTFEEVGGQIVSN